MKRVAEALGVSRSNLAERTQGEAAVARFLREGRRRSAAAADPSLRRRAADLRLSPHHGAGEPGTLATQGLPPANRKRVHRIMQRTPCCCSAIPAGARVASTTARSW